MKYVIASMLGHVRIGAGDEDGEVGVLRARRPHLLAVHDPLVAVALRPGSQRRQVGAGAGLAEQLAPDLLAGASAAAGSAARWRGRAVGLERGADQGDRPRHEPRVSSPPGSPREPILECVLMTGQPPLLGVDLTDSGNFVPGVPHDTFTRLRREDPVHWHPEPEGPGHWALTRYADVVEANHDWQTYSSERGAVHMWDLDAESLAQMIHIMLYMDPPRHTRYRLLVNKGFTPRMVTTLARTHRRARRRHRRRGDRAGRVRLRDRRRRRAAAPGDRRDDGRSPRGPRPGLRLEQPDGRQRGPRVRRR